MRVRILEAIKLLELNPYLQQTVQLYISNVVSMQSVLLNECERVRDQDGAAVAGTSLGGPAVPAPRLAQSHSPRHWCDSRLRGSVGCARCFWGEACLQRLGM